MIGLPAGHNRHNKAGPYALRMHYLIRPTAHGSDLIMLHPTSQYFPKDLYHQFHHIHHPI